MSQPRGKAVRVTAARHPWEAGGTTYYNYPAKIPKGCSDCLYRAAFNGHAAFYCNYMAITGTSRVKVKAFHGPDGGCAVKAVGEKTDHRKMSPSIHEARLRLYNEGMTDREIAEAMGVRTCTIANWRSRYSLPSQYKKGGKKK